MALAPARRRRLAGMGLVAALLLGAACSEAGPEPDLTRVTTEDRSDLTPVPGFDGSTIHVGLLLPTSGPTVEVAWARAAGLKSFLDYITTELGGIGGKYRVAVDVRGSTDAKKLHASYVELRDTTVLLAQVQGRSAVRALLPDLEADGVLAGPAPADVAWPPIANLLSVGTPDRVAAGNAFAWLMTEGGGDQPGTHVCSVVQQGSDAEDWQAGLDLAGAQLEVAPAPKVVVPAAPKAPQGVQPQVDQLRQAGCTVVFLSAGGPTSASLLTAASQAGFAPKWIAPAGAVGEALADTELTDYVRDHLVAVGDGPTAEDPSGLATMLRIRDAYAPGQIASGAFVDGYLQGKAIVTVLDAAVSRRDLSRKGVLAAAAGLRSVRFEGLATDVRYGAVEHRTAPTTSTISTPDAADPTLLHPLRIGFTARFVEALAAPPGPP